MGWKLSATTGVVIAVGWSAASAVGAFANPTSHAEALAAGDPAATAPSFKDDAHGAVFRGRSVDGAEVLAKNLACLAVRTGPSRCYVSAAALEAAELAQATAAIRHKRRPKARAAACGIYEILHIWVSADFMGSVASLEDRQRWANIGNG